MSRNKGAAGEREFVNLARAHHLEADRTAGLQAGRVPGAADVVIRPFTDLYIEVKRDERLGVDAMLRQAAGDAPEGAQPIVAWRRNGNRQWHVAMPAEFFFDLLGGYAE